jgi:sensor histidine kinase YesM
LPPAGRRCTINIILQLLAAENENLKIHEQLIQSEIRILQDQMNPHFLFNTLSMITQIATMENAGQTAELMETTINLLRYSMDKPNHMSTLYEELECARNYIHIQRLRFGGRINFELNIEAVAKLQFCNSYLLKMHVS